MLNKEKYEKEIYQLCCGIINMGEFQEKTGYDDSESVKWFGVWANKEYKTTYTITRFEKDILEHLCYDWLARELDGRLYVYENQPTRLITSYSAQGCAVGSLTSIGYLFPFITFESGSISRYEILNNCKVVEDVK